MNSLLADLYADTRPGCCAICDGPLPVQTGVGRKRRICASADCLKVWHRLHKAALRAALKSVRVATAAVDRAIKGNP